MGGLCFDITVELEELREQREDEGKGYLWKISLIYTLESAFIFIVTYQIQQE